MRFAEAIGSSEFAAVAAGIAVETAAESRASAEHQSGSSVEVDSAQETP